MNKKVIKGKNGNANMYCVSKSNWYSYQQLVKGKHGIRWKIYLAKYIKTLQEWKGCSANEFDYLINDKSGEIEQVRNVMMLAHIFPKSKN